MDLSAFDEDRLHSYPETNICALLQDVPPEVCLFERYVARAQAVVLDKSPVILGDQGQPSRSECLLVLIPYGVLVR